ncbi:UNC93-like protein isoform X2 [Cylas formicarius]|uniref:UNC93-like protein isoform X2 n=1 Tax=Cylas formicarius TaxID=197179 RepID=UPI002958A582|nr:UNC93-like protein isoform X2 [Cylas formicarius]
MFLISIFQLSQLAMETKFQRVRTDEDDVIDGTGGYGRRESWRIWKNVLVIGFAFMIHFTAFWGASNLQSSINAEAALGTFTLAAIYGSLILSNIFLPVIVIRWLGAKWTIAVAFITYMPFLAAQFYPRFYTMIPGGLAVGFGGGPLWCAKCTYLTIISEAYAKITGAGSDIAVTRFFGVFFMFYQFSQVWGNLISSAVLSSGETNEPDTNTTYGNATTALERVIALDAFEFCGANFCPDTVQEATNPNLKPPSVEKVNTITGIYLACMIAACVIVAFGVDSPKRYDKGRKGSGSGLSGLKLLAVTIKHLKNPYQILILPITMFIGAEQAFIAADFNSAFVSCGWGISNIGFVMICFGVCNGLAAIVIGSVIKITGRSPVICLALSLHVALIVTLLIWRPNLEEKLTYFLIAGLWGFCDAVWLVQINSLYGILFPGKEEASYSNFRLWESTGSVITYAYSPYLCVSIKLYLLLCLLIIGAAGYTTVEYMEWKSKRKADRRREVLV